jgi:UDPglucose 6-dehydrogenase
MKQIREVHKNFFFMFLFFFVCYSQIIKTSHNITILGAGYAGLVTGACLSEFGNKVICADIDPVKIKKLQQFIMPIYEPGLDRIVERNVAQDRLSFTSDIQGAIKQSNIIMIAVGTPMNKDGKADLSNLQEALKTIANNLDSYKLIVVKSTVPVGTCKQIGSLLKEEYSVQSDDFAVVSCPEFLREGKAVQDFLNPDRVIVGTDSERAQEIMLEIHQPLQEKNVPFVFTTPSAAETIKYSSNSFRAVKISFINEIANFCDAVGVDVKSVVYALGIDKMIGPNFLNPGPGYGGSCLPKDTQELVLTAQAKGVSLNTIKAAIKTNTKQQQKPFEKLYNLMNGNVEGKTIAIWGLAFKAETDDIRYSAAIKVIELLKEHGAHVKAYDPAAMPPMKIVFNDITYCSSAYDAAHQTDAIILLTEWEEFKDLDYFKIAQDMNQRIIVDARNMLDSGKLKQLGFHYDGIGRSNCNF